MRHPAPSSSSHPLWLPVLIAAFAAASTLPGSAGQQNKPATPVPAAALEKLLPVVDGWTGTPPRTDLVVMSPDVTYSSASTTLVKDAVRVKITLSDTGGAADTLSALAMVVVSMPEDFSESVSGSTVKRMQIGGSPASEIWDGQKSSGEITVVVARRFVAAVESSKIDSLATLRAILDKIDLKSLGELKQPNPVQEKGRISGC